MKLIKFGLQTLAISLFAMSAVSCDNNDDDNTTTVDFSGLATQCNTDGYWNACYTTNGTFSVDGMAFSHQSEAMEWDGVVYKSWYGFCPSVASDTKDYSDGVWVDHQWTSVTGTNAAGVKGAPYMVACWNTSDSPEGPYSCTIGAEGGKVFAPESVSVTNTTWSYYAMLNGSAFSKKFTESDWQTLLIAAYLKGVQVGTIDVALASAGKIVKEWKKVDLSRFGTVDQLVFTMASSDTSAWGMNTPAYFCLDALELNQ